MNNEIDSGMSGKDVARAEMVWTNLPVHRKWHELHTYEKALVCHVIERVTRGEWSQPYEWDNKQLKPCPFCGGDAIRVTLTAEDGLDNEGGDVITCIKCGASSHVEFGYKENLVSKWNTRIRDCTCRAD